MSNSQVLVPFGEQQYGNKNNTMVQRKRNPDDVLAEMVFANPSSRKIDPFAGRNVIFNEEYYNNLVKQFDTTYLSRIVDLHNTLGDDTLDLNELDKLFDFFEHYKKELCSNYLYSLIFPEKSKGTRIQTKFPIPSMTFQQKSSFTITPNLVNNWYLQWTPQTLLSSAFVTANNGNLLLNNAVALNGSTADVTAADYTSITVDRLQNASMIQACRLVSASMIISYIGSIDAHSGVLGGGVDISYTDSNLPDTSASVFSVIDDKIWNIQSNPYDGLRLIYFPKDYSDLNFIRPDISTQSNGLSTCIRMLAYGQNLPTGSSVRVDLYRNFEAIPFPTMADFVSLDFSRATKQIPTNGEPALDIGSKVAEAGLAVSKISDAPLLEKFAKANGGLDYSYKPVKSLENFDYEKKEAKPEESRGFFGSLWDIATGLGKILKRGRDVAIKETVGNLLGKGAADFASNVLDKVYFWGQNDGNGNMAYNMPKAGNILETASDMGGNLLANLAGGNTIGAKNIMNKGFTPRVGGQKLGNKALNMF